MKEELLEPLLRRARVAQALPVIRKYPECQLLDVGCGWEARLLKDVEPYISLGVGVDRQAPAVQSDKLTTLRTDLEATFPFVSHTFDVVTMLAVLEHLSDPLRVLVEIRRVLRSHGTLILTVPSHAAKPVLEFLAYKLKLVNPAEIADHKRYYGKRDLRELSEKAGFQMRTHRYFQLGFNNFATLEPETSAD
jgi:2-polyprenyl-3-methyl-5-hydroxy-6-metoxy-1,4-benzoquinol methylase